MLDGEEKVDSQRIMKWNTSFVRVCACVCVCVYGALSQVLIPLYSHICNDDSRRRMPASSQQPTARRSQQLNDSVSFRIINSLRVLPDFLADPIQLHLLPRFLHHFLCALRASVCVAVCDTRDTTVSQYHIGVFMSLPTARPSFVVVVVVDAPPFRMQTGAASQNAPAMEPSCLQRGGVGRTVVERFPDLTCMLRHVDIRSHERC